MYKKQDYLKLTVLLFFWAALSFQAAAGVLRGTIIDKQTKEPLIGATVQVVGTTFGPAADLDGKYVLNLESGTYRLQVRYMGYRDVVREQVRVGADTELNFEMEAVAEALEEVSVKARKNMENERMLQMERRQSMVAIENIGAKEMSLKGASNVEEGVKKITGISIASAGQLIVRGLGDRYSTTTLNGLPIASPNPDNKLIPLDLFPAATVKNITVSKVYEAGSFADYSGAHIDIGTKENTGGDFFTLGFNTGGKFNTLGKTFYYSDKKGTLFTTPNLEDKSVLSMGKTEFREYARKKDLFGTTFAVRDKKALPDFGGSAGLGKSWDVGNQRLSLLASFGISNSRQMLDNGYVRTLNAEGYNLDEFSYDSYTSDLKIAGLANLGYTFRQTDRISYTFFYARNAIDTYMQREGTDAEGDHIATSNSIFRAYSLLNNQLAGHHEFGKRWTLNWSGSYGITNSDEPDRRQVVFFKDRNTGKLTLYKQNQTTSRYFSELDENEGVGDVRAAYRFGESNFIRFGGVYKSKKRDFQCMNFYYDVYNLSPAVENMYDTDGYLNQENIANGLITVNLDAQPRYTYYAKNDIGAAFAEVEYLPLSVLMISFGLRYEQSQQWVRYWNDGGREFKARLNKGDFFPALNIKYDINKSSSLRFSVSRTVTRPSFIEMSPFLYQESYGSAYVRGNENLKNAYNYNVDLRYDLFPQGRGDMFSVTGYFKRLDSPIERTQEAAGGSVYHSFRNAEDGIAAGIEVEFRKELIKDVRLGANASFMYTNVKLPDEGVYTESERALQGASPFLINADLSYTPRFNEESDMTLALVYNVQGPRIHSVGIYKTGDIKQETLHTLDFVASYAINKHFSLKAQVKDLLNSEIRFMQKIPATGSRELVESFRPGSSAEIGFSYKF